MIKAQSSYRLSQYYLKKENFEKSYEMLLLSKEIRPKIITYTCGFYYTPFIYDYHFFNVLIGLNKFDIFMDTYGVYLWEHFIRSDSKYFDTRAIPFIKMIKANLSKKERKKLLKNILTSIKCHPPARGREKEKISFFLSLSHLLNSYVFFKKINSRIW